MLTVDAARPEASPYHGLNSLILALLLTVSVPPSLRAEPLAVGQSFPSLAEFSLEGALPDASDAKVIVVDFWASWCAPCRAAFPVLDGMQAEFGPKGLRVIAVSVDQNASAMQAFLKRHPVGFTIVRDASMSLVKRVDVPTMPTTFVLDARGVVRFVHAGFAGEETRAQLRAQVMELLEEKP